MATLEERIAKRQKELSEMKQRRRQRSARKKKVKSEQPPGRPEIGEKKIEKARELAATHSIADVAFIIEASRATLYNYGISRKKIPLKQQPA